MTTTTEMRDLATNLRKDSLERVKNRLLSVRFNKAESPSRINHGAGWDRTEAMSFLADHDLPFRSITEDGARLKFRHRLISKPLGDIDIVDDQFPRGVDMVLEAA